MHFPRGFPAGAQLANLAAGVQSALMHAGSAFLGLPAVLLCMSGAAAAAAAEIAHLAREREREAAAASAAQNQGEGAAGVADRSAPLYEPPAHGAADSPRREDADRDYEEYVAASKVDECGLSPEAAEQVVAHEEQAARGAPAVCEAGGVESLDELAGFILERSRR
jgi:hypothetical protein